MGVLDPFWPQGWTLVLKCLVLVQGSVRGHGCLFLRQPSESLCGSLATPLALAAWFDSGRVTPSPSS